MMSRSHGATLSPKLNKFGNSHSAIDATIKRLWPAQEDQLFVLNQLVASVEFASSIAPKAWSLKLVNTGFNLWIGPVPVMAYETVVHMWPFDETTGRCLVESPVLHLKITLLLQDVDAASLQNIYQPQSNSPDFSRIRARGLAQPSHKYAKQVELVKGRLTDEDRQTLAKAISIAQPFHFKFIEYASKKSNGGFRDTAKFPRVNSKTLFDYAKTVVSSAPVAAPLLEIPLLEGDPYSIIASKHERNLEARAACLNHYGMSCVVCNFNFSYFYGDEAKYYVQVHHLTPLAFINSEHAVDPISDLRPVCANCHAVIHLRIPPFTPEEVRKLISANRGDNITATAVEQEPFGITRK
jgi:hypothetical protein